MPTSFFQLLFLVRYGSPIQFKYAIGNTENEIFLELITTAFLPGDDDIGDDPSCDIIHDLSSRS